MTSPGGRVVAKVSVRVVPDTSGFREKLRAELTGIKDATVEVRVKWNINQAELIAQLKAMQVPAVKVPVELIEPKTRPKIKVEADTSPATREVDAEVAKINAKKAKLKVDAEINRQNVDRIMSTLKMKAQVDVDQAKLLASFRTAITAANKIGKLKATVDVDQNWIQRARSALGSFLNDVGGALGGVSGILGNLGGTIASTFGGAFDSAIKGADSVQKGFSGIQGTLVSAGAAAIQFLAIGTAVAVAGAAATAAWGFLATGVAALPALLGLIGIPLAAVLLGFDEAGKKGFQLNKTMKTAIADISAGMKTIRADVAKTFAEGLAPAVKDVAKVIPALHDGLVGVARSMSEVAQKTASFLASSQGISLIQTLMTNVGTAIRGIDLRPLLIGFLSLAGNQAALNALVATINAVGRAIQTISQNTHLDQAFKGLEGVLVSLTRAFGDLVNNGITVFAAAAPGVQQFIDNLAGFFNRFDWTRLGTAVGNVFSGLGDAIRNVPQSTIDDITKAFEELGLAFKDPQVQQFITDVIALIPVATREITAFVREVGSWWEEVKGFWTDSKAFFQNVGDQGPQGDMNWQTLKDEAKIWGDFFKGIWNDLTAASARYWNGIKTAASGAWGWVTTQWGTFTSWISGLWNDGVQAYQTFWTDLKTAATDAWTWVTTQWTTFTTWWQGLWAQIQAIPGIVWDWIKLKATEAWTWITTQWGTFVAWWQGVWTQIQAIPGIVWDWIKLKATETWTWITTQWATFVAWWQGIWTQIQAIPGIVWDWIKLKATEAWTWITTQWATFTAWWQGIWTQIQAIPGIVWDWIKLKATEAWTWITTQWGTFTAWFAGLWAGVAAAPQAAWTAIQTAASTAWTAVTTIVSGAVQSVLTTLQSWGQQALTAVQTAWNNVVTAVRNAWNQVVQAVTQGVNNAITQVQQLPSKAVSALGNMAGLLVAAGKALIQGFINGILSMLGAVVAAAKRVAAAARSAMPFSPAKVGPLSGKGYTLYSGHAFVQGFIDGILAMRSSLVSAVSDSMRAAQSNVNGTGQDYVSQLLAGLQAKEPDVMNWVKDLVKRLTGISIDGPTINLDQLKTDLASGIHASVAGSVTGVGAQPTAAAAAAAAGQVNNIVINNPQAEKGSDTINRRLRTLSALGVFG